ncbi:hypothetical protein WICPIJ_001010 [Wickerhamomyces pijperi]|uniref:Uncharacterized protein n=1 Tax=Wickerhamomyces pijperi TaxID=599730 RepID=A0A9P8QCK7_WICPI|nr:hypothetical protein WICPIJ_001010 [Wickerhamomyces pijperi]
MCGHGTNVLGHLANVRMDDFIKIREGILTDDIVLTVLVINLLNDVNVLVQVLSNLPGDSDMVWALGRRSDDTFTIFTMG